MIPGYPVRRIMLAFLICPASCTLSLERTLDVREIGQRLEIPNGIRRRKVRK